MACRKRAAVLLRWPMSRLSVRVAVPAAGMDSRWVMMEGWGGRMSKKRWGVETGLLMVVLYRSVAAACSRRATSRPIITPFTEACISPRVMPAPSPPR
jgi:hypothetical protein